MIGGTIDQLWRELLIWAVDDEQRGTYYCGCAYVAGAPNCPHHGDPVERWPGKPQGENA